MKTFRHYITEESTNAASILGRNLKAKAKYTQLTQSNPEAAQEYLTQYAQRQRDSQALTELLKDLTSKHLSRSNAAQITKGDGLAQAYETIAKTINEKFPQLTTKRIVAVLNKPDLNTLDIADKLLDVLYPQFKDV